METTVTPDPAPTNGHTLSPSAAKTVDAIRAQPSGSRIVYLLWSNKHQAWWKSGAWGYTMVEAEAGRFSEAEATRYVVQSAQSGLLSSVTCMVAAPDNWGA